MTMGRAYLILSTVTITIIPVKSWWRWCRLLKMIDRDDHDGHGDLMMIQPFLIVLDHIPDWHRSRFRLFLNSMLPLTASHLFKNFTKLSSVSDHLDFDRSVISPSSSKPSLLLSWSYMGREDDSSKTKSTITFVKLFRLE